MFGRALRRESHPATMQDLATNPEVREFRIDDVGPRSAVTVLAVYGDADLYSAPELRERLCSAISGGASTLVVDLSETTLIDSTSLGVLLGVMKQLRAQGGEIRLVVPRPELRRILEITMLDRVFTLHETQEDALAEPLAGAAR